MHGLLAEATLKHLSHYVTYLTVAVSCLPGKFYQRGSPEIMDRMRAQSARHRSVHFTPFPDSLKICRRSGYFSNRPLVTIEGPLMPWI